MNPADSEEWGGDCWTTDGVLEWIEKEERWEGEDDKTSPRLIDVDGVSLDVDMLDENDELNNEGFWIEENENKDEEDNASSFVIFRWSFPNCHW